MISGFSGAEPKPAKRPKKAPKPIKRGGRIARVSKSSSRQAEIKADAKWSKAIKAKGPCAALRTFSIKEESEYGVTYWVHDRCIGPIDPAHGFPRTYAATRHDVSNGWPLCRAAHDFFTAHPREWMQFMIDRLGTNVYEKLRQKAMGKVTQ